jgi:hypothetical protein
MSPICKECGAQVLFLLPRQRRGVCETCAAKHDAERLKLESLLIQLLRRSPLKLLTEIQSLLEIQGIRIALSSLHNLVMGLVESGKVVDGGKLVRSGTRYNVEDQSNVPEKET